MASDGEEAHGGETHADPIDAMKVESQAEDSEIIKQEEETESAIPHDDSPAMDNAQDMGEDDVLRNLTGAVRDQDEIERDITLQANAAMVEADDKRDQARIDKLEATRQRIQIQLDKEKQQLARFAQNPYKTRIIQATIDKQEAEIRQLNTDISDFQTRINKRHEESPLEQATTAGKAKKHRGESQRDYLIRTGKITPFAKIGGPRPAGLEGELAETMLNAEDEAAAQEFDQGGEEGPVSHQQLRRPGFAEESDVPTSVPTETSTPTAVESEFSLRPRKRQRTRKERSPSRDFEPSGGESDSDIGVWQQCNEDDLIREERRKTKAKEKVRDHDNVDLSKIDDGNEVSYRKRLQEWVARRSRARRARRKATTPDAEDSDAEVDEWLKPAPDKPDQYIDDDLRLPGDIHSTLFGYQKTGVQWLAELHRQQVGGIVGDEMGLGKTVQLIALVAALHHSKQLDRPVLIVAPATLLRQWVSEFHRWWPPLRVAILHSSGSGMMNVEREDDYDLDTFKPKKTRSSSAAKRIVNGVVKKGHVLVTTYTGLQTYADVLRPIEWEYAVLDEGHKIRNPNAAITITCKELHTRNRIILSGTPVQNNLTELWSLFDFISPARLGTLLEFREQFEIPIRQGGYANASNFQVIQAEQRAEILKGAISKYLLQRLKVDVAADLPEKTEQVLFCKLTDHQRKAYESFLGSEEVTQILNRQRQSLYGIDILRKICNHPDLLNKDLSFKAGIEYGSPKMSSKLQLTKDLLQKVMIPNGHKTLLFSQGKLMLNIIEKCIRDCGISYLRLDGETPIEQRQPMIDKFNTDPNIHVFLITTRTGGLGTNLTGADRIIIFDPDWNPSTDLQARERAWRLGQDKPVKIYRLMTEGTIEEKIYHRQIFKQFMTNKVLKDPKQRSSYDLSDLYDLFSYTPPGSKGNERSAMFKGAEVNISEDKQKGKAKATDDSAEGKHLRKMDVLGNVEDFKEEEHVRDDERRMLSGIFARTVGSAYDHEQIVSGKPRVEADVDDLRSAAREESREAAAHLRRAGAEADRVPIGTVTWTGEVGSRPGASSRRRGGPGSGAVMSNLADRQGINSPAGSSDGGGSSSAGGVNRNMKAKDFAPMIKTFITRQGGSAVTKMLVDHFGPYCKGKKQNEEFQEALTAVAEITKRGSYGRAVWSLKGAKQK